MDRPENGRVDGEIAGQARRSTSAAGARRNSDPREIVEKATPFIPDDAPPASPKVSKRKS
jgi:hypothetical protein